MMKCIQKNKGIISMDCKDGCTKYFDEGQFCGIQNGFNGQKRFQRHINATYNKALEKGTDICPCTACLIKMICYNRCVNRDVFWKELLKKVRNDYGD